MNILFTGGGTAGHTNPALAIAEGIKKKYPEANIGFIGRAHGRENDLIKEAGFELFTLKISGLSRTDLAKNFKIISEAVKAKKEASKIIKDFDADMVIGTGGYVCWPVIKSAKKLGIKTVIHESNTTLGLTTKLLMRDCNLFLVGNEITAKKYRNAIFTGNPLRDRFKYVPKNEAKKIMGISPQKRLILSVGGSIGAKKLNEACLELMRNYSGISNDVCHLHSVGHRYYEELKKTDYDLCIGKKECKAVAFINNMPIAMQAADVIISRCGAMTLSEIAFCALPSILVPSPNVAANHQMKNAMPFEERGAAIIINEDKLDGKELEKNVKRIFSDSELIKKMQKSAKSLSFPDSTAKIIELIENEL